jgi:hypothetical protein
MSCAGRLISFSQAAKSKDTLSAELVESIRKVRSVNLVVFRHSALTFAIQAVEPMESRASSPNAAEPDTADHTEVADLPATSLNSAVTNIQHDEAESEAGAGVTVTNNPGTAAVPETQGTAETQASRSGTVHIPETQDAGVIEGTDSNTTVDKSKQVTPTTITPAHSDRAAWPDWMRKHVAHVEAAAISDDFKLLVQQYIKLETSLGFPKGQVRADDYRTVNRS